VSCEKQNCSAFKAHSNEKLAKLHKKAYHAFKKVSINLPYIKKRGNNIQNEMEDRWTGRVDRERNQGEGKEIEI
jgi:hypothetical protein